MKNILAVDLGTKCGIAYNDGTAWVNFTYVLATKEEIKTQALHRMDRRFDCRIDRLFHAIRTMHSEHKFDIVVFEDIQFASFTYQVQLWSSLRAALLLAFDNMPQPTFECVPVGTLKKFATGNGAATKPMMSSALWRQHPNQWNPKLDDNAVDAGWLWHWANAHLARASAGAIIPA